uniref:NAD(P)H-quinone oxidoreductase subunit S, chloroplastic n=1 Tax=Araucaria cunninghamii TaxID=56994 RepID=A0A0D6QYV7_ARACU
MAASPLFFRVPVVASYTPTSIVDGQHSFAGQSKDFITWVPRINRPKHSRRKVVRARKFNLWELLGGRGLAGGEEGVREELNKQIPSPTSSVQEQNGPTTGMTSAVTSVDDEAFEKELQGLTGGFPGGEKGLQRFLKNNPPPPKEGLFGGGPSELGKSLSKPKAPLLPLLMPGMIVIVNNPKNPYHMFCGTVQRVTDGKVGVLFEGGNWDKLVTFSLQDLERRSKGPPMSHPKSAILEDMNIP